MSSKFQKIINLFFYSILTYSCLVSQALANDSPPTDIVVTGQRLESAMNAGDYYLIGYYQGLLAKQRWEAELAQNANNGSSSQTSGSSEDDDSGESVERCLQVKTAELALCRKQTQARYTQRQKNCSRVVSIIDHLPVAGGQAYTKCVDEAKAILQEDLSDCQFVSEYQKAQCYD